MVLGYLLFWIILLELMWKDEVILSVMEVTKDIVNTYRKM
jgi:hypothetical protein